MVHRRSAVATLTWDLPRNAHLQAPPQIPNLFVNTLKIWKALPHPLVSSHAETCKVPILSGVKGRKRHLGISLFNRLFRSFFFKECKKICKPYLIPYICLSGTTLDFDDVWSKSLVKSPCFHKSHFCICKITFAGCLSPHNTTYREGHTSHDTKDREGLHAHQSLQIEEFITILMCLRILP